MTKNMGSIDQGLRRIVGLIAAGTALISSCPLSITCRR